MLKFQSIIVVLASFIFFACNSNTGLKAKKLKITELKPIVTRSAFDPKSGGFKCDSLKLNAVMKAGQIKQLNVLLGSNVIDSIKPSSTKIPVGAELDCIFADYNFDGYCDLVIPDKKSASKGGMDYYYFLFDTLNHKFKEIKSLPKFIGNFKLDVKNQRVKIYCPNEACFTYYKFENNDFTMVHGEFQENH